MHWYIGIVAQTIKYGVDDMKDERDAVILAMIEDGHSQRYIADKMGMSKTNVSRIVKRLKDNELSPYAMKILEAMKADRKKNEARMMELIESSHYFHTVERAIAKLTDKNMDDEIAQRGIGNIYKLVGTFIDKSTNYENLKLKREQVALQTKQLEIKEKELELRLTNPEAFHEVHIINDAPETPDVRPN